MPGTLERSVPWRWWEAVALYLAVNLGVGASIALPFVRRLSEGAVLLVLSLVVDLALIVAIVWFVRRRSSSWSAEVGLAPPGARWTSLWTGVPGGAALYIAAAAAQAALAAGLSALVGRDLQAPAQLPQDLAPPGLVLAVVLAVIVAPIAEEAFFRGLLFRSLRRHGFWTAATVSGVSFGAVHLSGGSPLEGLLLQIPLAGVGVGLAWIAERWGLAAAIGAHVCFNAIGTVLILGLG
jgi:hypothetical protein